MKAIKILRSNLSTIILIIFSLLMIFNPDAKGLMINGLMKVGLFQPDIANGVKDLPKANSGILFKDGNGNIVNLSEQKGKVILINFWATWCPPCRAEMPSLESLHQKMKPQKDFLILMVDVDNDYESAKKFMDKKQYTLPVYTPASSIPKSYMGGSIPTTLIIDKSGDVVFKHEGAADFGSQKVTDYLHQLLKQ